MDGNGRWGLKKRGSRNYGHLQGLKTVDTVIRSSIKEKIPYLTLYTFSTENWKRPRQEINFLFDLIRKSIKKNLKKYLKDKKISEDECKEFEKKIQTLTDKQIAELEKKLDEKEKEIMAV